jgi:4'-phosphopantetheinyl transferase EntD
MNGNTMIADVVPPMVASAELFTDPPDGVLFEAELAVLSRAVKGRRLEFGTVRHCARRALSELGYAPAPILKGQAGEPQWPEGVVGSMTHCREYRAAAVALAAEVRTIGIDAEPLHPLPDDLLRKITVATERTHLARLRAADSSVCWDRLLFSCKESVYKAWFPLVRRRLGFLEASVVINPIDGTFSAHLLEGAPTPGGEPLQTFHGQWLVRNELILTAITVPIG